ncbi:MAG: HAD superfamily hydrolase (TIGR01509 family) [Paraglaciecola sp.]|jgi:HAD superfamily hydrolase (TIGR01509 family)
MTATHTALLQHPIELIIFDCDGVLIDSEVLSKRVLLHMLFELGVQVSDTYFESHFLGHSFEHVKAKILADYGLTLASSFAQDYQTELMQAFTLQLKPTVELEWMLPLLNVPYCVATSSSVQRVNRALSMTNLRHYFGSHVFTACEVENGKPAPDLFIHAASKMGIHPKNCLVIEDSQAGIQGAQAANMQVIRYAGASHMQKYTNASAPEPDSVITINHWQKLYELAPLLRSSSDTKR